MLAEDAWGFCDVRATHRGTVQDMYYSAIAAPGVKYRRGDDVEWGFSGLRKITIAEVYLPGCNLKCEFCVAPYLIRLGEIRGIRWIEPADLLRGVTGSIEVLGFSGGEPSIHAEYVTDVFTLCRERGIHTVLESNGYMTKSTAEQLAKLTDHIGFGLKASLDPTYYKRKLGIPDTQPIHDAAKIFAEHGCEVMFTNLTDPNLWDDKQAFEALTKWIARDVGPSTRIALSLMERVEIPPPWTDERIYVTSRDQREQYVQRYQKLALDAGLSQVFAQTNSRKRFAEHRERLEKMGVFRALERLDMNPSNKNW
jgi:pyruvate-formate lyase-activating enzyme